MRPLKPVTRWGLLWYSRSRLDGVTRHIIMRDLGEPVSFSTRAQARRYRDVVYGYIKERGDLRREPHGWQMPRVVRLVTTVKGERAEIEKLRDELAKVSALGIYAAGDHDAK